MAGDEGAVDRTPEGKPRPAHVSFVDDGGDASQDGGRSQPPPPPIPSSDPGLLASARAALLIGQHSLPTPPTSHDEGEGSGDDDDDIFRLPPITALRALGRGIEALVRVTGDIPPTPPPTSPTSMLPTNMRGMQAEKEHIARSNSERSLAKLRAKQERLNNWSDDTSSSQADDGVSNTHSVPGGSSAMSSAQPIDGVRLRESPSSSATAPLQSSHPFIVIGENSQPLNQQHAAITRKFYSKQPPPITIGAYLERLHRFCPMSTAVYLACSLYIHRLAVDERAMPVTRRSAHRLLLAGLRVAMKALEDLSYGHVKMAKVGGVRPEELARLEISFCFLTGFELYVREEQLRTHWKVLREGTAWMALGENGVTAGKPTDLNLESKGKERF